LKRLFRVAEIEHLSMSGGEPLLEPRLPELVLFARLKGSAVTIISNGNAATGDDYRTLIDLKVSMFEFPYHSSDARLHDEMTNQPGSWQRARQSIEQVLALGGQLVAVIVLTRLNVHSLKNTLMDLNRLGVEQVMVNRFNVGGRGIERWRDIALTADQLRQAFEQANEVAAQTPLNISSNVCTPFCLVDPQRYPELGFSGCTADVAQRPITLDVRGDLRFCNHSPVVMGNIFRQSLTAILTSDYVRKWRTTVPELCRDCLRFDDCFAGCRSVSEQLGLDIDQLDPTLFPAGSHE